MLPIQQNQRFVNVVQNEAAAVLLQLAELVSGGVDLLAQRRIRIERPEPRPKVLGNASKFFDFEENLASWPPKPVVWSSGGARNLRFEVEVGVSVIAKVALEERLGFVLLRHGL
jgi:hypothetical protein